MSDSAPITVKASAAPVVMSESTKVVLVAFFAVLADHFIRSDLAMGAVMAASGALATAVWGVWRRLKQWKALRALANLLPDEIARVGK